VVLNKQLVSQQDQVIDSSLLEFRRHLKVKIVPLVFYACDEDNNSCSYYVWSSIVKCLNNFDTIQRETNNSSSNFWSLLNVKKAFIPKVIALIRNHGNGNANSQNSEIVFSSLYLLVKQLSTAFSDQQEENENHEKLNFYKDLFSKLYDGVNASKEANKNVGRFNNTGSIRTKIISSLFDCLTYVINELTQKDQYNESSKEFILFAITNYVSK
jgi:hypothetical protein